MQQLSQLRENSWFKGGSVPRAATFYWLNHLGNENGKNSKRLRKHRFGDAIGC
jgi:hypothetical protein